jgi:6-phosphogluconolactonase
MDRILEAARQAIADRARFLIALAGGDTPRPVYEMLREAESDWASWHVYYCDERCLPALHGDRNSRMAGDSWLDHVALPASQQHVIPAEHGAIRAAASYADSLRGIGDFDLVLLGLGEDGHTASLFPGAQWGTSPDAPDALAVTDAPKPPAERVSLSAARLSRSREVVFLVEGKSKSRAVADWRSGAQIPAASIAPPSGIDVLVNSELL